ncbi:acyl-CoA dehydrogenase family protein [Agrobacterium sp. SHOUNA12C]|uniref:Dibenzothiophene monooxygenase n=1 Tax=Rhizobium rhizogenes NBRC 13257 TaxID=1220581 RepID=A0AA87U405_RHIRH|nr:MULTISPECIES: acyl-CoA dehydrogenase family protein [Rhizobium]KAA6486401.1 acyl-CoA dehydrogenase [Agrobacterium sp. ICMP 7243]MCJ9719314.1 acyl-CoA dehydrogenase family protein [Agrobacterium sp. BETTINA12B]MCJ9758806.1 acyl-CoA dehydrogenase family protein [Agrobacterium sp. SHOUNA12C]OCJ20861.1 acyl-CoA dehydrogenase [Agrobacterium sp. B133/95]EJK87454.1 acyl-CoA dehydrogenase [Rhizobium sp. AP16]
MPTIAPAIQPVQAASRSSDLTALLAKVPELATEIAKEAARRDLERELPFEAFRLFREAGLGTLRIPVDLGGPGGSVVDYIEMIMTIGAADSNVAHALRSHFNFTEGLLLNPNTALDRTQLSRVLSGKLFGGAHTEQGTKRPGDVTTRLTKSGDNYRLNGRKWYATGTAFSDFASFSARNDDDQLVGVLLPVDRKGITILDDWDGMGQRLTASGGVLLEDVEVLPHEISTRGLNTLVGRHVSTLRQLHLAASMAGAVRGVLAEGMDYVRRQARSTAHSAAETANADPFVQKILGEIAAGSFAVDTLIRESARALDRTVAAFAAGDPQKLEAALVESALTTARTQIVTSQLALAAATNVFELGGGSATSRHLNLDRHWRNIRTLLNHNPLLHKARVVGDYYINGTTTHLEEGKVF